MANRPPLVYVAGPFSAPAREGVEENIALAVRYGLELARIGAFPVIPHANTSHPGFEELQKYDFWIAGTRQLLIGCDSIFLMPKWVHSSGARGEEEFARELGIPVLDSLLAVKEWMSSWKP